jgi:nucleoside phosphorylase
VKYVDNEQAVFPQLFYGDSKKGDDYRIGIGEQISLWPAEPKKSVEDLRKMASIGVITALEKEFAAVKAMLPESVEWTAAGTGAGRRYLLSRVPAASGGDHVVAVALMNDMGNNSAAVRATQLLGHFPKIDHIVMCGIAGGIPTPSMPGKFAHLGDVVVSDQFGLIQYDFLKVAPLEIVVRDRPRPPDAELLEALKYLRVEELEGKRRWETYVANGSVLANGQRPDDGIDASGGPIKYPADPTRTPRMPRLFSGPIASANTLLRDPAKRDELHRQFGVLAVEMESSGIADAAWISGRAGYLTIRGICDYCDPAKGDVWQGYAAVTAAACTRAIIESMAACQH